MWLYENRIVLNPDKWHQLITNKDIANQSTELGKNTFHAETGQKLLIINKDLNFQSYTKLNAKTANQKLSVLIRVTLYDLFQLKGYIYFLIKKDSSIIAPYYGCFQQSSKSQYKEILQKGIDNIIK